MVLLLCFDDFLTVGFGSFACKNIYFMANFTPFCKKILRFFTNNFQARPFLLLLSEMVHRNCHSKPHFFEHFVLHLQKKSLSSQRNLTNAIP